MDCSQPGCDAQDQPDDRMYKCVSCDKYFCDFCRQTTGKVLTKEDDSDYEDNPDWWCSECNNIDQSQRKSVDLSDV